MGWRVSPTFLELATLPLGRWRRWRWMQPTFLELATMPFMVKHERGSSILIVLRTGKGWMS